ncbi:MAG TPA: nitroreductase family deazaflavin-dependent oxidoreductase [Candidatus Dormibacteraeota bacterium]|nr:nitroreductase family deazaflavin-dependent oxidoreductase [Candidatus Dormibacteraeota bacterium]
MSGRAALGLAVLLALTPAVRAGVPVSQLRQYEDASTLELTTTGRTSGAPRTVTIWFVADDQGRLYVQSGKGGTTDWYRNLLKTPAVKIRIAELAMSGVAAPVEDLTEVARVHELFRQKYLRARVAEWIGSETGHGKVVQLGELTQLP